MVRIPPFLPENNPTLMDIDPLPSGQVLFPRSRDGSAHLENVRPLASLLHIRIMQG